MRKDPNIKDDENFLSRWSRRKIEGDETPTSKPVEETTHESQSESFVEPVPQPEKELTDADMPPLEQLDESSNYSEFFSPGVSGELRKLALRKLFRSAKFNIRDGLDDYDDDFRSFAALGDIITSDMKHRAEMEAQRAKEEAEKKLVETRAEGKDALAQEETDGDERIAGEDDQDNEETKKIAESESHIEPDQDAIDNDTQRQPSRT